MSHKKAKQARRFIKNYLKKKEFMENQNKVQYTFAQLQNYVNLALLLTGRKPEKLELVDSYYNWYVQECQAQAEALGLKTGFKDDKVAFMGVPLEKKVNIVVPEVVVPKDVSSNGAPTPNVS